MIDYAKYTRAVASGMRKYVGAPVIQGDQNAPVTDKSYLTYKITTIAGENNGTWQEHDDGMHRLLVESIWSFSSISDDYQTSVNNAIKARDWILHVGRAALSEAGISVKTATGITNRDNVLTVEYERKNGFDVVFYVYDEVESPSDAYGYIETVDIDPDISI